MQHAQAGALELTLMTRDGCRLCAEMKRAVQQVARQVERDKRVALTEVDISTRPELEARWGTEIPVLLYGEREIARHRVSATRLANAISQLR